jgi:hydroxyquinol 1,2-dioxygenase
MSQVDENTVTDAVVAALSGTAHPRAKQVMESLVRHLHAFIRDIEPTDGEWMQAIDFLTRTGQTCTETRQEFILLSDTLGATTLVDAINHRFPSGSTENSVLGPFFLEARPTVAPGADIANGVKGAPLLFEGRVLSVDGAPIANAEVDVWHSDADGHYDVMLPEFKPGFTAMRGLLRSDDEGRFAFRSVMPASYPIPDDGPVGEMMQATGRSVMRPAHVHVRIAAQGYAPLTSMLFVDGDPFLEDDPVFGVKPGLAVPFERRGTPGTPDFHVAHDFVMARETRPEA